MADENLPAIIEQATDSPISPVGYVDGALTVYDYETGEALPVKKASDKALLNAVYGLDWIKREVESVRGDVTAEIRERMDRGAKWTWHHQAANGALVTASVPSPGRDRQVDAERLYGVLSRLVRSKRITRAAMDAAVVREVSFKSSARGIDQLLKLEGPIAEKVKACIEYVEKVNRRVSVKEGK